MPQLIQRNERPIDLHDPSKNEGYIPFMRNIVRRHGTDVDRAVLEKFAKATYGAESATEVQANVVLRATEMRLLESMCDRIRDMTPVTEPVIF